MIGDEIENDLQAPWRIGVDVGGTFTDLVVIDGRGMSLTSKVPTTPENPADGVMVAVEAAAQQAGISVPKFLGGCRLFVHGSTVATNALLEGKGGSVGLLTTVGFRDTLEIRRGVRTDPWDHRTPWPDVLVPRYRRRPVTERVDAAGSVSAPIELSDVEDAVAYLKSERVESIAICFLNSYLNPVHEVAALDLVKKIWPEVWTFTSANLAPVMGEFERCSTAVVHASLAPRVVPYLRDLEARLQHAGLTARLLLVQSNGGAISVDEVSRHPASLVLSGPAAGGGALEFISRSNPEANLIAIEIGGTSCDVTLVRDHAVAETDAIQIGDHHVTVPAVDIHTISAGGGTIAWIDDGGLLQLGPEGAGAVPGPACYGRGGQSPTVTDAQLVLGRLRAGRYAGGRIELDEERGRSALIDRVAAPLGIEPTEAAAGIVRLMEQQIIHAVERVAIAQGFRPSGLMLVGGGGAGGLHIAAVARALGCRRAYVPRFAGVMCAFGMCNLDVRLDYSKTCLQSLDEIKDDGLTPTFQLLEAQALAAPQSEGFSQDQIECTWRYDLRYQGQQWPIIVREPSFCRDSLRQSFEREHQRLFGHYQPNGVIELQNLHLTALGHLPSALVETGQSAIRSEVGETVPFDGSGENRSVFVDAEVGIRDVRVFDGERLRPGHRLIGPAIIEEATTTVMVGVNDRLEVDRFGNYALLIGGALT